MPALTSPPTFLKLLETFKRDFELVWCEERGGIVQNLDTEEGDDGHSEASGGCGQRTGVDSSTKRTNVRLEVWRRKARNGGKAIFLLYMHEIKGGEGPPDVLMHGGVQRRPVHQLFFFRE